MAAASISDFGMACIPARKNRKLQPYLLPRGGDDDQRHRFVAVEPEVPVVPETAQHVGSDTKRRDRT